MMQLSCCASRAAVARPVKPCRPAPKALGLTHFTSTSTSSSSSSSSGARLRSRADRRACCHAAALRSRADRACCRAAASAPQTDPQTPARLYAVHRFFDSLHAPEHSVEDLLTADCHFEDSNQACYRGYRAIKHRLQELHEALPKLKEASEVADAEHAAVAAHWVAQGAGSGTLVFSFNADGLIERIAGYTDGAESEFLEA